eukprot:comp18913_c0_seq1/m.21084 comp18913_c0_seq1/g.21084  ORF comp18913_c0_seq1/g.21084 comp18913_c0_seq1/m.21084 type:complete len:226 (-) comp18913_c0_seq1:861-1538(-)
MAMGAYSQPWPISRSTAVVHPSPALAGRTCPDLNFRQRALRDKLSSPELSRALATNSTAGNAFTSSTKEINGISGDGATRAHVLAVSRRKLSVLERRHRHEQSLLRHVLVSNLVTSLEQLQKDDTSPVPMCRSLEHSAMITDVELSESFALGLDSLLEGEEDESDEEENEVMVEVFLEQEGMEGDLGSLSKHDGEQDANAMFKAVAGQCVYAVRWQKCMFICDAQ